MYRRLIYLVPFVLMLGTAGNVSAELVAYWSFDEGSGDTVLDSSGNGNDGTINGAEWGQGKYGPALNFNGQDNYIEIPTSDSLEIDDVVSVAAWINWTDAGDGWLCILANGQQGGPWENYGLFVNRGGGFLYFTLSLDGGHITQQTPNNAVQAGEWLHACATWDGSAARIYVNGEMVLEQTQSGTLVPPGLPLRIGHRDGSAHYYNGIIDDVRVYNHALPEVEILAAMEGGVGYPYALGPSPQDGALYEDTWVNLTWSPGSFAVSHDVYLGDNFDDVNDDTVDSAVFRGNQTDTMLIAGFIGFPYPDGLVPGTTYYWRIDEVNEAEPNSPWKGDVWSFWVPPKTAYEPSVADGAKFVLTDVELSWTAGFGAMLHTVYFGDDLDTVTNATGGTAQSAVTFNPGALETDKTYYWRVDEFEAPVTHKGDVWSFTTVPQIEITDPSLVGWWTFDEGHGTTAVDWSGHGNHGSIMNTNDPLWVDGYQITAMDMAGAAYVHVDGESWSTIENEATITLWVYGDPDQMPRNNSAFWAHDGANRVFQAHIPWGDGNVYFDTGGSGYDRINKAATPAEYEGRWRHWTFVKNATTGEQLIYLDGVLWHSGTGLTMPMVNVTAFTIGSANNGANIFPGMIDNVRLYNKALTVAEIQQVMLGNTKLAGNPVPDRNAFVDIRDISSLSWSKGETAASHDVYFSQDRDAVAGADNSAPEFQGNQAGTSLSLADLVEFGGGDYYWLIDEVEADGTVIAGTIWKFTVPGYLIVEDFESYNEIEEDLEGSNRIYLTWIDGYGTTDNGSQAGNLDVPFMSQGRDSAQAMPLHYDNAGRTSEATRTLVSGKDWTVEGVTKLVIWFSGASGNAADRMFVALGNAVVYHPDDAATQDSGWNEWVIDLQEFANQGMDLTNVGSITLGFGTRGAPVATGGTGTVHFDDISLYR